MRYFIFFVFFTNLLFSDWQEGVNLFKEKKYKEAIPHFQIVVEAIPEGFSGHYMLGLCYLYLNDYDKAMESLKRAVELKPEEGEAAHKYLTVLMMQKKYSQAHNFVKSYREEYIPKELRGDFYKLGGLASYSVQDYEKAINLLQKAEALIDGDEVPFNLGLAALQSKNYELAAQAFQKAHQRNQKNIKALQYRVQALIELGRISNTQNEKMKNYNNAFQEAQKLLKEKEDFETLILIGEVALGLQKYEDALNYFDRAKDFKKSDGYLYLYMGQAYSNLGKNEDALSSLEQAYQLLPEQKKKIALNQIGYVYEKMKSYDKAMEYYKRTGNDKKVLEIEEKKKLEEHNRKAEEQLKEYEKKLKEQGKKK